MGTPAQRVLPLAVRHFEQAQATLAKAFADDPMAAYFFPQNSQREAGLRRIFRVVLRQGFCWGEVDALHGGDGIAVWLPSEKATADLVRGLRAGMLPAALAIGWAASRRILRFLSAIERTRLAWNSGPHWYLLNLAVCPERQGQGLGSTLLRHGLARAERQRLPVFLETTNARAVDFYRRHGFQLVQENLAPDGGPQVWSLANPGPAA